MDHVLISSCISDTGSESLFNYHSTKNFNSVISANEDDTIIRRNNQIKVISGMEVKQVDDYYLGTLVKKDQDWFLSFKQSAFNNFADPFAVVRLFKGKVNNNIVKGYKLKPGDVIQLGKQDYTVAEIYSPKNGLLINQVSLHWQNSQMIETHYQTGQCRICLEEGDDLIDICSCKGSAKLIHFKCAQNLLRFKLFLANENEEVMTVKWNSLTCELCQAQLPYWVKIGGTFQRLFSFQRPTTSHLLLINLKTKEARIFKGKQNTRTFVGTSKRNSCCIDGDDLLDKKHAAIYCDSEEQFWIQDNKSKHGTLLKIQKDIKLFNKPFVLQAGNVVLSVQLKE